MKILIQSCISRDVDITARAAKVGIEVVDLGEAPDLAQLTRLEAHAEKGLLPTPIFCSLQVGRTIRRGFPMLARGLDMPLDFLRHGHYSALLDPRSMLNAGGIYLPWARIAQHVTMLGQLFGPAVFLRPDSAGKPFTGFVASIDDLAFEVSARTQTDHVRPEEMVFLAPARRIPEHEFRVWILGGKPATSASYSWDSAAGQLATPEAVWDRAVEIARVLEQHCANFVADFVVLNGAAKLVELNAISTSGWYRGMDPAALLAAVLRDYN